MTTVIDEVDVADLESEAAHHYELLGAREGEQAAEESTAPDGTALVDGGRTNRSRDRFSVKLPNEPLRGIARIQSLVPLTLRITNRSGEIASLAVVPGPWTEVAFDVPAGTSTLDITADGPFASFHYWIGK